MVDVGGFRHRLYGACVTLLVAGLVLPLIAAIAFFGWWFGLPHHHNPTGPDPWFLRQVMTLCEDTNPKLTREYVTGLVPGATRQEVTAVLGESPMPWVEGAVVLAPYSRHRVWQHTWHFLGLIKDTRVSLQSNKWDYWELAFLEDRLVGVYAFCLDETSQAVRLVRRARMHRDASRLQFKSGPARGRLLSEALGNMRVGDNAEGIRRTLGAPTRRYARAEHSVWLYCGYDVLHWEHADKSYLPTMSFSDGLTLYFSSDALVDAPFPGEADQVALDAFNGWPGWELVEESNPRRR